VRRWQSDQMVIIAARGHPMAGRKVTARQLLKATWVLREQGSGTREAADRWLMPQLPDMQVELELGSNEAVKRAVAAGIGLGCLSRLAVREALSQGWLVELQTTLPALNRSLSIVLHRGKVLGSAAQGFLQLCMAQPASS
jgi:DNA-binding transcriptional LysR family regulator